MKAPVFLVFISLFLISCSHHGKHLKRYDLNKDGQVTKKEWDDKHDMKFKKYDKNGDGVLSGKEFHK